MGLEDRLFIQELMVMLSEGYHRRVLAARVFWGCHSSQQGQVYNNIAYWVGDEKFVGLSLSQYC